MHYIHSYPSPMGKLLLASDGTALTGLWFVGQQRFARGLDREAEERDLPVFQAAERWLDIYFSGREPDFQLPLRLRGTAFQQEVWAVLCTIPYGKTMTYGEIAQLMAEKRGSSRMPAQAVGGAVGSNPISIMVPCHRVVGANGSLTGYAGGLERKKALLALEREACQL